MGVRAVCTWGCAREGRGHVGGHVRVCVHTCVHIREGVHIRGWGGVLGVCTGVPDPV